MTRIGTGQEGAAADATGRPALTGWRTLALALACAFAIGGLGGLIGLGGGEFRLPVLVGLLGFAARAAVPMNQLLSLVTLCTALALRWHTDMLVGVGAFAGRARPRRGRHHCRLVRSPPAAEGI